MHCDYGDCSNPQLLFYPNNAPWEISTAMAGASDSQILLSKERPTHHLMNQEPLSYWKEGARIRLWKDVHVIYLFQFEVLHCKDGRG